MQIPVQSGARRETPQVSPVTLKKLVRASPDGARSWVPPGNIRHTHLGATPASVIRIMGDDEREYDRPQMVSLVLKPMMLKPHVIPDLTVVSASSKM